MSPKAPLSKTDATRPAGQRNGAKNTLAQRKRLGKERYKGTSTHSKEQTCTFMDEEKGKPPLSRGDGAMLSNKMHSAATYRIKKCVLVLLNMAQKWHNENILNFFKTVLNK